MRIAILTELYAPSLGGQELFFAGLAETLTARGHSVDIYAIGHEAGMSTQEVVNGVPVYRAPIMADYKKPRWAWAKRNWGAIVRYAWHVRQVAKKQDYDFYLLNQWPLLHALALPRKARKKAMLHWCEIRTGRFYRAIQKYLPKVVRFNAAISDSVGEAIAKTAGRPVLTLPSGIKTSDYRAPRREGRGDILALGRIAAHKNLTMLIESFELLKQQGYAGRLRIAGGGPDLEAVRARAAISPSAGDIELLGLVDDDRKIELLARSEILAMPSQREGFPRVVAEAMASGLPVVTADYPENGTKDVVRSYGVGTVTGQGAAAFAAGIVATLGNWESLSDMGRKQAPALDWVGIASAFETYIRVL